MDEEGGEERTQSKYNAAVAQLYRLDALWQSAHLNSRSGRFMKWNWDLDAIWRELSGDANDKDEKKYFGFHKLIVKYRKLKILYHILTLKETFLRKMQNDQGKGTAYRESDEDYMD